MPKNSETSHLDRSALHLLHRAGQGAADAFQSEIAELELTPRQFAVLLTVAKKEGLSQTQLVEETGIDRSTLADVVRRMIRKGLLQRRRTRQDARAYAVKLTEEGVRILEAVKPVADRVDERILDNLTATDRDRFIDDLNSIVRGLKPQTIDRTSGDS